MGAAASSGQFVREFVSGRDPAASREKGGGKAGGRGEGGEEGTWRGGLAGAGRSAWETVLARWSASAVAEEVGKRVASRGSGVWGLGSGV